MSLIRYQAPEWTSWPSLDRWSNLRDELNSIFETPWTNFGRSGQLFSGWSPALDLYENKDNVVVVVELPGMKKEDIEISLHDGTLTISGERKTELNSANDESHSTNGDSNKAERSERYVGKFRRSISLASRVDPAKVSATYRDGLLTITLPKAEEAKPRQITVNAE